MCPNCSQTPHSCTRAIEHVHYAWIFSVTCCVWYVHFPSCTDDGYFACRLRRRERAETSKCRHHAADQRTLGSCVRSCEPALKVRPQNCTVRNCRKAIRVFSKTRRVPPLVLRRFAGFDLLFPAGMSVPPPLHDTGADISIHRHLIMCYTFLEGLQMCTYHDVYWRADTLRIWRPNAMHLINGGRMCATRSLSSRRRY